MNNSTDAEENFPVIEPINMIIQDSSEIDLNWIPFTNWLRFRFDNDGVIIITNKRLGSSVFLNITAGLIIKLCNGRYSIIEIIQGIIGKFPEQNEAEIFQDTLDVIMDNYKMGNLVFTKIRTPV